MEFLIHYASLVSLLPLGKNDLDALLDHVFLPFSDSGSAGHPAKGRDNIH
jgi:hypothetical protein